MGRVVQRETGATASLLPSGQPVVRSFTGGQLDVVTRPSQPGFNPLDLLYASISACLVLSTRNVASERGLLSRIERIEATVRGTKADDGPSRVASLDLSIIIVGDIDGETKRELAEAAERVCTVSNTLKALPTIRMDVGA